MRSFFVAFSITAIFTCYAKANPIQNGSFEATGISSGTEVFLTPSSTEITGWSVDDGSGMHYVTDGNPQGVGAVDGTHVVSFGRAGGHGGSISQVFGTVPGTAYEVTYWITQTEWNDDDGQTMSVEAYAGSTSLAPAVSNNLPITQNQWSQGAVYTFTATSASTKITFRDTTPQAAGSDSSWALDLVEIAPAANPGNLLPFDPKPSDRVHAAAIQPDDGKVIIAGWFNTLKTGTAQQITRQRLARLNPDGTVDEAFYPFPDGHVYAVAVLENGQILVGGDFSKFQEGGASSGNPEILRTDLALLNPDGSVDESFNANLSGGWSVLSVLPLADGRIYIGGNFNTVGAVNHARVALLNPNGSPDPDFNYQATAEVTNMAVDSQNRVLLGSYQYVRPGARAARVGSDGVLDADFNPSPDWTVYSLNVQADGKVLIGGSFDNLGVNAIKNLARVNPNGSWDETFQPGAGTNVYSVTVLSNHRVLATGNFNQFGAPSPTTVYGLASLEESGNLDTSLSPLTGGATVFHALPDREGKLLILSNDILQTAQGSRNYMARFQGTPAFDFLSATSSERVEWLRSGGSAEPAYVVFDLSTDQGTTWTRLGTATRAAGGWELTGLDLPGNGKLRARARVNSSTAYYSCSSLLETVEDFTTPLDVPGEANLWLSGQPEGIPAEEVDAAPGQSPVLANISLVPGHDLVFQVFGGTHNGPGPGTTGPDGGDAASHSPENGIGPMTAPLNALVGVFVTGNPTLPVDPFHVPAQPAPSLYLDFSNPDNRGLQVLEPKLFQPFFIGDGLDAGFNTQHFRVPPGATRLFLGSFDAFTNKENSGQFTVIIDQVEPIELPALPVSTDFTIEPDTMEGSLTFTIQQTSPAAGLTLRVESTLDPNDPHSWTALPNGSAMVRDGDTWELIVDESPVGNRYFRVVAEATGYTSTSTEYQENGVAVPILIVTPVVVPPAPVPLKLISWWPGENAAWDVAGTRQGSMKNSANEDPYDVGKVGRAFWFDGIDDYVEGSYVSGSLVQDLTIEVWVQPLDDIGEAMIVSKKSNDTDTVSYSLLLRDGRPVFRSVTDGVASELAATGDPLPVAEWTHLAFTEDDEVGRKIYVNGTLVSSVPTVSSRSSTGGPVTIGAFVDDNHPAATPGSPFDGLVDELTLYSRALTSTEIQRIVAAGKSGKERHDPARDFSATANPNLPWLYGWVDGSGSPVPPHLTGGNPSLGGFFPPPAVLENTTSVYGAEPGAHLLFNKSKYDRASFAGYARGMRPSVISLAPRQFAFHPAVGGDNDYAVLQWLAPEAGKYVLSATFTGVENSPTSTDVFLYKNETELFTGDVSSFLGDGISTTEELDLSEDDTVTWIVGGGASAGLDYTGVVASVVKLDDYQPFARPEYLGQGISGFTPPLMNGKTVRFGAVNTDRDDNPNMTAKVQYSATPTVPGSWDDVPGGAMTASGPSSNTFFLFTNSLPVGTFAFRIATTATGPFGPNNEVVEATTFSAPTDSFTVLEAGPHYQLELDVSSASDPDGVTTHRGDTLTYRVRFRNSGGLVVPTADEVKVLVRIPDGTSVTAGGTPGHTIVSQGGNTFASWTLTRPLLPVDAKPVFTVLNAETDTLLSDNHNLEVGDLVEVYSDGGALPTGLVFNTVYEVFFATTNQFRLRRPGETAAADIANGGSGTLKLERLWQTRTLELAVADPTTAQETTVDGVDFGDVLTTFARITTNSSGPGGIADSDEEETIVVNPLSLTAAAPVVDVSPLKQGGTLSVDFTVKNKATSPTTGTFLRVLAPPGLTIRGGVFVTGANSPAPELTETGTALFSVGDLADASSFLAKLKNPTDIVSSFLSTQLRANTKYELSKWQVGTNPPGSLRLLVVEDLNLVLRGASIWAVGGFFTVPTRQETDDLRASDPTGDSLILLNRMLLEDAYPVELLKNTSNSGGQQILIFDIGPLAPGAQRVCQARFRVQYDLNLPALPLFDFDPEGPEEGDNHEDLRPAIEFFHATASINRPSLAAYESAPYTTFKKKKLPKKKGKKQKFKLVPVPGVRVVPVNYVRNGLEAELENPFGLEVLEGPRYPLPFNFRSNRPYLNVSMSQEAAGILPGTDVAVITQNSEVIVGSDPVRRTNQIRYKVTYRNYGDEDAEFIRLIVPIPEESTYVEGSVKYEATVNGLVAPSAPKIIGNRLIFNLAYLDAFQQPGWERSISFLVQLKPNIPLATVLNQPGANLTSRDLEYSSEVRHKMEAKVMRPARMIYVPDKKTLTDRDGNIVEIHHQMLYQNTGETTANDVEIRYEIPEGFLVVSADFLDADGDRIQKSNSIVLPTAPSREIVFPVGTVNRQVFDLNGNLTSGAGWARVRLEKDPNNPAPTPPVGEDGYRGDGYFSPSDSTNPEDSESDSLVQEAPSRIGIATNAAPANVFIGVRGPKYVPPSTAVTPTEITYQVTWGSAIHREPGAGGVIFPIPEGTTYVTHTGAVGLHGQGNGHGGTHRLAGEVAGYDYEHIAWAHNITGGSKAEFASVTVRVNQGLTGAIVCANVRIGADQSGVRYGLPGVTIASTKPSIREIAFADTFSDEAADRAMLQIGPSKIHHEWKLVDQNSTWFSLCGADGIVIKDLGTVIINIGDGNIVAAGGGNIVAGGGGNITVPGSNIVAGGGGNIVAGGGGNIVAGGGGNIQIRMPDGNPIPATDLYANIRSIVAGGGGNIVAGNGNNLVRHLIGNDAGSLTPAEVAAKGLIGLDGASIIGLDGVLRIAEVDIDLATGEMSLIDPQNIEPPARLENVATMLTNSGEGLSLIVAQDSLESGLVIDGEGANLTAALATLKPDGAPFGPVGVKPPDGVSMLTQRAAVVANDGAGVVANDGAGVVANDGAGVLSNGNAFKAGSGVLTQGGTN